MDLKEKANELKRLADEMLEALGAEYQLPEKWDDLSRPTKEASIECNVRCSKDISAAMFALSKLYDLRQEYWRIAGGWEPDWDDEEIKYVVELYDGDFGVFETFYENSFLAFPTEEQAEHFLYHHRGIIEQAKPFL